LYSQITRKNNALRVICFNSLVQAIARYEDEMWNDGRSRLRMRPLTLPDVLPSDSARHGQVYCKGPRTALSRGKSIRGVKGSLRPHALDALTVLRVVCSLAYGVD